MYDPVTSLRKVAVSLVLTAVGLAACYFPACRVTMVDPTMVLRCEWGGTIAQEAPNIFAHIAVGSPDAYVIPRFAAERPQERYPISCLAAVPSRGPVRRP